MKMSIKSCIEKAKVNYESGKVEKSRISFICFRKNELIIEEGTDDSSAMEQANKDWEENYGKFFGKLNRFFRWCLLYSSYLGGLIKMPEENPVVSDLFVLTNLDKKIKAKLRKKRIRRRIKRVLEALSWIAATIAVILAFYGVYTSLRWELLGLRISGWIALFIVIIASVLLILRILEII